MHLPSWKTVKIKRVFRSLYFSWNPPKTKFSTVYFDEFFFNSFISNFRLRSLMNSTDSLSERMGVVFVNWWMSSMLTSKFHLLKNNPAWSPLQVSFFLYSSRALTIKGQNIGSSTKKRNTNQHLIPTYWIE